MLKYEVFLFFFGICWYNSFRKYFNKKLNLKNYFIYYKGMFFFMNLYLIYLKIIILYGFLKLKVVYNFLKFGYKLMS